jgi:hypothetical protein
MGRALHRAAFPASVGGAMNDEPATRAVALVEHLFALLHECRALVPQLERAGAEPEPVSAQAERLLYYALVGAIKAGLVRTAEDALTVLRQASQPLGPMGESEGCRSASLAGWGTCRRYATRDSSVHTRSH